MTEDPRDSLRLTAEQVAELKAQVAAAPPPKELSDEEADRIFGSGLVFGVGSSLLQAMIAHGKREHERKQREAREAEAREGDG